MSKIKMTIREDAIMLQWAQHVADGNDITYEAYIKAIEDSNRYNIIYGE